MRDLNEIHQESTLPKTLIHRLDTLSTRCMDSGSDLEKPTCLLSLANFYVLLSEHKRAMVLLDYLSSDSSRGGRGVSVRQPSYRALTEGSPTPWDLHQYRVSLAKAETLLERGQPNLAVDELLEHSRISEVANVDDVAEFLSLMWLALASKAWKEKLNNVVPKWDLLGGSLGKRLDSLIPKQLEDAWNYKAKAWTWFAMSRFAECKSMLDEVVIPALEKHADMCEQWPNLWVKGFGILALVAAEQGNERLALDALSKTLKAATKSHDAPNRKFQLLIRMEAMAMLSKTNEASAAEAEFLGLEREIGERQLSAAEESRIYIGPKAFVRTMAAIAWSSFRHPLSHTLVDVRSGVIVENQV
jgi:hypothetical protein